VLLSTIANGYEYLSVRETENRCQSSEVNMCRYVTCANEGTCRQTDTPQCFTCDCKVGFTGAMCQTKENIVNTTNLCDLHPCFQGGICFPLNNTDFLCQCPPSTTGRYCEQVLLSDPCDSHPCFNGGICISRNQTFECVCPPHTTGYQCEMNHTIQDP
jgi:Notch-like protein